MPVASANSQAPKGESGNTRRSPFGRRAAVAKRGKGKGELGDTLPFGTAVAKKERKQSEGFSHPGELGACVKKGERKFPASTVPVLCQVRGGKEEGTAEPFFYDRLVAPGEREREERRASFCFMTEKEGERGSYLHTSRRREGGYMSSP